MATLSATTILEALEGLPLPERIDRELQRMEAAGEPLPNVIRYTPEQWKLYAGPVGGPVYFVGSRGLYYIRVERCNPDEEPFL